MIFKIIREDMVEQWVAKFIQEVKNKFEKEEKLLTLDAAGYHPEDKNFKYYAQYTGKELIGFLSSPNLKHSGVVSCVDVSPDGKWIISGSYDGTLKLWDVQSGKEVRTFKGHMGSIHSVCFAPGGKTILSGAIDCTLKLWDLQSGQEVRTFKGHSEGITSVCFAPGGKNILSGSRDQTLKLWDINTGTCIKTIPFLWIPREIQFQPGSPGLFATANGNGTVTFFDFRDLLEARMLPGNSNKK